MSRFYSRRTAIFALAAMSTGVVLAQSAYPTKPIRIIVPNPPGGGTDITARLLGERLAAALGQPVVIDNRAGANGAIAAAAVANADPDGYTLLAAISGVVQNPWLVKNLPYRLDQLAPVSMFTRIPIAFAVSPSLKVNTLKEFIALAKAKPDVLSFASYGNGSTAHAYGELLNRSANIKLLHVPYKGEQPAVTDLLGGQVSSVFAGPGTLAQQEQAKNVKILAVASAKRTALLPHVPTFIEAGVPEISDAGWSGIFAPAKTPKPIIDRLNREINAILRPGTPTTKKVGELMEVSPSTVEEFGDIVLKDYGRWGVIFKDIGITPQ